MKPLGVTGRIHARYDYEGSATCHLLRVLLLEPLKTVDGFLLGEVGRIGGRGCPVSLLRLLSCAPRCGTCEVFRVEPFLLVTAYVVRRK